MAEYVGIAEISCGRKPVLSTVAFRYDAVEVENRLKGYNHRAILYFVFILRVKFKAISKFFREFKLKEK